MISDHENEQALLKGLGEGCPQSFKKLYDQYNEYLYLRILRLVKSEAAALELLQDTFVKVWEKRQVIVVEKSFKGYLTGVAQNLVMDFFRNLSKNKKNELIITEIATRYYEAGGEEDVHQHFEELNQAIALLPPQRQRVFTLCKIEGKSYQEVSEMLGVSVNTINDHIVKATRFIKKHCAATENIAITAFILIKWHS